LRIPAEEIEQLVPSRVRQWLLDPGSIYSATRLVDASAQRWLVARARRRPHRHEPHRRHCGTEISPDRDTTGSSARCCWTCASLPTAPSGILPTLAENPGFSRNQGEIRKETDCLLEGNGFELLVPRGDEPGLRQRGYTEEQIREMKPEEAHRALGLIS
jgi:hypothetical protein